MSSNSWHCVATRSYNIDYYSCLVGDTSNIEFYGAGITEEPCAVLDVEGGKAMIEKRAFAFTTYSSPIESGNVEMRSY